MSDRVDPLSRSIVVVGAGPGIGLAVARRFHSSGYAVAVIARSRASIDGLVAKLNDSDANVPVIGLTADISDDAALFAALDAAVAEHGVPDVLVYNAGVIRMDRAGELSSDELLGTYAINVVGAAITAGHLGPLMARRGHGTILITGGMAEPKPDWFSLSLGKYGVRTLTELLARQFGPSGVHVATVAVTEAVVPGTAYDPDVIAEQYFQLHNQEQGQWQREIVFTPGQ